MSKIFNIHNFDDRKQFEIKLQIALLNNTVKIRLNSRNPEKYDEYISERIEKLRTLLGTTARFAIVDNDNVLYDMDKNQSD